MDFSKYNKIYKGGKFSWSLMGRIKTRAIKRVSVKLVEDYFDQFKETFKENQVIVSRYIDVPSKKLRNIIAGYVTRLVKSKERI